MRKQDWILLFLIFFLGAALRFYELGDYPIGFHRDEAFLGYNAYSILKTARDMSGAFLPAHLESFLYSPAGYSYVSIPFVYFFDLSPFSTRFASAFFGSISIFALFFLVVEVFQEYKERHLVAFSSVFLLAISPWHINLSRTATENVVVTFFILLGVLFFVRWLRRKHALNFVFSFIFFGITYLMYQAPRAFLPFFLPFVIWVFISKIEKRALPLVVCLYILIILVPLFPIVSSKTLSLRIKTVSVFAGSETQLVLDELIREDGVSKVNRLATRVFHNKVVGYGFELLQNYFKHFSYDYFFTDFPFPDRYRVPKVGLFYLFELPILLWGLINLLRREGREKFLLFGWVMLAVVGSSLTFDDIPNVQRTLIMLPALSIVTGFGVVAMLRFFEKFSMPQKFFLKGITLFFVLGNILFYLHQYYVHAPRYRPWYRHDGYKQLVEKVNGRMFRYKKAVITDRESAPTIFFLFFGKYDPFLFQTETKDSKFRDFDRISFGRYVFTQEECPLKPASKDQSNKYEKPEKGVLYINSGLCNATDAYKLVDQVKRRDDSTAFYLLSVD